MAAARQRVVVGIDGSAGSRAALAWALAEAARRGADLEVVTAFPVEVYWIDPYLLDTRRIDAIRSDTESRARGAVGEVRRELAAAGRNTTGVGVQVLVTAGAAAPHLVQCSEDAALLVVGSRGRGAVRSTLAGSVALHCAAHARCPVVVVHPASGNASGPARVVVGLDDSDAARAALEAAMAAAAPTGASVDVVLAYQAPDHWSDLYALVAPPPGTTHEQVLRRGAALVEDTLPADDRNLVRLLAVEGPPGPVLMEAAQGADLLVVGSRSRSRLSGVVLGSAALHCVMHAPCPVLVVHPDAVAEGSPPAQLAAVAGTD